MLVELTDDDPRAELAAAAGQRHRPENRTQDGRLAAAVRPEHGQAIRPRELEVERSEPKLALLQNRALKARNDLPTAALGRQAEVQLPRFVGFFHAVEPLDPSPVGLLHVLRLLLLASLSVAALLPALHPSHLLLEAHLLGLVGLVGLVLPP